MKELKYIKSLAIVVLLGMAVISCKKKEDFILPDHNGVDSRTWDEEGAAQFILNGAYMFLMPDFPYQTSRYNLKFTSDENIISVTDGTMKKVFNIGGTPIRTNDVQLIGTKYQSSQLGDNKYFDIARCNIAIREIPKGKIPKDVQRKLLGQFYMLRAMGYFDLVCLYGGVPLVLEFQDPANLKLEGRKKASECFQAIVNDLDTAAAMLDGVVFDNDATDRGKLTKLAAVCYKARVLLFQASRQFNPTNDPAKWTAALKASEEAYDLCQSAGIKLMDDYGTIFQTEGKANTEAIIVRSYSNTLEKRFNVVEEKSRPSGTAGGSPNDAYVATTRMIDAYLKKDGTKAPSIEDPNAPYDFWTDRDPRFKATIAYNGSIWELNGEAGRRQWTYRSAIDGGKPFFCKRFSNADLPAGSVRITNDKGGGGMDWIEMRFAEVILNYAECLNETGDLQGAKDMVRMTRVRAGMDQGDLDYGLSLASNDGEMRALIENERMVEFAFEGRRGYDLRRTRKMHLLTGTLYAPYEVTRIIKVDGVNYDLRTQLEETDPNTKLRRRDTLDLTKESTYKYFFQRSFKSAPASGAAYIGDINNTLNFPEINYFYALPNTFLLSSPLLEQTIGWENGTFDPLN